MGIKLFCGFMCLCACERVISKENGLGERTTVKGFLFHFSPFLQQITYMHTSVSLPNLPMLEYSRPRRYKVK